MSPRPECSGPINITHRFTANRVKKSHQATNRTENAVQLARNIEKKLNATRDAQVQRLPFLAQRFVFLHELGTGVFLCKDIKAKKRIMCRVSTYNFIISTFSLRSDSAESIDTIVRWVGHFLL